MLNLLHPFLLQSARIPSLALVARPLFAPRNLSLKKIEYFGLVDQSSTAEMGSSADLDAERQPDSWLGPTPLTVVAAAFLERGARLSHGNRREPDGVSHLVVL